MKRLDALTLAQLASAAGRTFLAGRTDGPRGLAATRAAKMLAWRPREERHIPINTASRAVQGVNEIKGRIVEVTKGQTTARARINIGHGVTITASTTNEAVDELATKVGKEAYAVINAWDAMVGK